MLRDAGFVVRSVPFDYSAAVGRWAMPLAGTSWALVLALVATAGSRGHPRVALGLLVGILAAIVIGARPVVAKGVTGMPFARRRSVNLVATRGGHAPRVWLVAHLDSKSQPIPMVARVAGVAASAVVAVIALVVALAQLAGLDVAGTWVAIAALGVAGAAPVIGSVIGARSPGALDDGSGVATVLLAATADGPGAAPRAELGVLLTSAEELGLAGARAWAEARGEGAAVVESAASVGARALVLNVDVVDDVGAMRVMLASPVPAEIGSALVAERVRVGRLPPGVLVDAIALAAGGFAALTVSKATLRTLARVHTPTDRVDGLDGSGIASAALLVRRLSSAYGTRGASALDHGAGTG